MLNSIKLIFWNENGKEITKGRWCTLNWFDSFTSYWSDWLSVVSLKSKNLQFTSADFPRKYHKKNVRN
jgi:hypothetical protein